MAQSLATHPYVGEAGGLRDWDPYAHTAEGPWVEAWTWTPVAPAIPAPQAQTEPGAAAKIPQVLVAWRAAEQRLQVVLEASPMRTLARSEVARLRAEYQRLFAKTIK